VGALVRLSVERNYDMLYASSKGHVEVLRWCHAQGCPWNEGDCVRAATLNGHLDVLKWVLANGNRLPLMSPTTFSCAVGIGNLAVVRWMLKNEEANAFSSIVCTCGYFRET
jgi:uncharacterized protein YciI